jgi:hypothetical protein
MFFGGSSRFSPTSADSCPPDVSACAGMVGSLGLSPKLSPLFHSEDHAKRDLKFQFSGFGDCSGGLQAGVFGFSGAPLFVPYAAKWDSVFVLQDQQNEHLRKNSRGWCEDL